MGRNIKLTRATLLHPPCNLPILSRAMVGSFLIQYINLPHWTVPIFQNVTTCIIKIIRGNHLPNTSISPAALNSLTHPTYQVMKVIWSKQLNLLLWQQGQIFSILLIQHYRINHTCNLYLISSSSSSMSPIINLFKPTKWDMDPLPTTCHNSTRTLRMM